MYISNGNNIRRIENEAKYTVNYIPLDMQIFSLASAVDKKEILQHVADILLLEVNIIKDKEEKEDEWCHVIMDSRNSKTATKEGKR